MVMLAVQVAGGGLPQQGSLTPPHWQLPCMQTPAPPEFSWRHAEPVATQRPTWTLPSSEQQSLVLLHLFPAQHGLPVTPQAAHIGFMSFARSHTAVPLHCVVVPQHGSPGSPQ